MSYADLTCRPQGPTSVSFSVLNNITNNAVGNSIERGFFAEVLKRRRKRWRSR